MTTNSRPIDLLVFEGQHVEIADDQAFGYWHDYEININREDDSGWYIRVRHPDGCHIYDGYWTPDSNSTIDDAVAEAFAGAELLEG